jgi:amidophosphoribosyltransferase
MSQSTQNTIIDSIQHIKQFPLKHECGIAMVRLRKPLNFYQQKYGSWMYGLNKLYLLMEKQHNRGQEGAGAACVKLDAEAGEEFMFRERAEGNNAISEIFDVIHHNINAAQNGNSEQTVHVPYAGQLYMGHLRYSTTGKSGISFVHPFLRRANYRSQNLTLCGNFNLTNVEEVFHYLSEHGQHPRQYADTFFLLEQLGHRLDREVELLYTRFHTEGLSGQKLTCAIEQNIDMANVLRQAATLWDGGYVICGMTGSGESFALRDKWGIRPAFYYIDDEIVIIASERPVIQTAMNINVECVKELLPGQAILINANGNVRLEQILPPEHTSPCSFERIYFSRGSDTDIYRERKLLGANLVPQILQAINNDLQHTVFSFIPNTAEVAFYGMINALNVHLNKEKSRYIAEHLHELNRQKIEEVLSFSVRSEKVAIKDIKLRTFITQDETRNDMAAHVYDITYGCINAKTDNLVIIDDSIVRGTTLRQSIIKILARLQPKKIIILSSAPQIRYPDFYGIDMSDLEEFIAFRATIELIKEQNITLLDDVYHKCKEQQNYPKEKMINFVKELYAPFSEFQISQKIAQLLTPEEIDTPVEIIFQSLNGLHHAIPNHGDWYFSGNYPTPGGNKLINKAFIGYMEKHNN